MGNLRQLALLRWKGFQASQGTTMIPHRCHRSAPAAELYQATAAQRRRLLITSLAAFENFSSFAIEIDYCSSLKTANFALLQISFDRSPLDFGEFPTVEPEI